MINLEQIAESKTLFDGRYRLLKPLNTEGATADVWLALDTSTIDTEYNANTDSNYNNEEESGLLVAIKIYRPKNALDFEGEQRFRNEFKVAYDCHHTNLLQPTSFSIYNGIPYLVLPYCKQGSSEQLIGKTQTVDEMWKFISDVSSGLAKLHTNQPQIIHQDIKPANILIDDDNFTITDFGISSKTNRSYGMYDDEERSGTLAYMAPERFGDNPAPSPESDVWAFGATLCEILIGGVPFGEEGGRCQMNGGTMIPLKGVPSSIRQLIKACLDQDPAKRPSAQEIAKAAQARQFPLKKNKALIILPILAVVALMGWGVYQFLLKKDTPVGPIPISNTDGPIIDTVTKMEPVIEIVPVEEVFEKAKAQMDTTDSIVFWEGFNTMDSLCQAKYIPAMYEIASTYGWYDNKRFKQRKKMLNIDIDKYGQPTSIGCNHRAVSLYWEILEQGDTNNAYFNGRSAYMLASYYGFSEIYTKKDTALAKEFIEQGVRWASVNNDTVFINKLSDMKNELNKTGKK